MILIGRPMEARTRPNQWMYQHSTFAHRSLFLNQDADANISGMGVCYFHVLHFAAVEKGGEWFFTAAPAWRQPPHNGGLMGSWTPPSPSPICLDFWFNFCSSELYIVLERAFRKLPLENVEGSTLLERCFDFLNYYRLSWMLKLLYRSDNNHTHKQKWLWPKN